MTAADSTDDQSSVRRTWLFQCNPKVSDYQAAANDGWQSGEWTVSRYLDELSPGDRVVIWASGGVGVIAIAQLTELPHPTAEGWNDAEFWTEARVKRRNDYSVAYEITDNLIDAPISRAELAGDGRFASSLILRMAGGTNPFPVEPIEWSAIEDRLRVGGHVDPSWTLAPGDAIRRAELHDRYGGSRQGGISPSKTSANIIIFTDHGTGKVHGYRDEWAADGTFEYTGEGQVGDQKMTRGNRAILNHVADGKALRLFDGSAGTVRYVGQFKLALDVPWTWARAPQRSSRDLRRVIRFRLQQVSRSTPTALGSVTTGQRYRNADETVVVAKPASTAPADSDIYGRGLRQHRHLQNELALAVTSAGFTPLSPKVSDPAFDLAWVTGDTNWTIVEVKSLTDGNEVQQIRLGIGQLLDYSQTFTDRGFDVVPVLYLPRRPVDRHWLRLSARVGIKIRWPNHPDRLGGTEASNNESGWS